MSFAFECIDLLDAIIVGMLDVPVFALFLGGSVLLVAFGLMLYVKAVLRGR